MESNRPTVIKRSSEFLSLKQNGKRTWPTKWLLLNYSKSEQKGFHFGVTASRKVGPAVVRNKLKRWVREYLREYMRKIETASDQTGSSLEVTINIIFKPIDQGFYRGLQFEEFRKAMDIGLETLQKAFAKP